MKRILSILILAMVAFAQSCEHKDLCYHHPHTANVRLDVDWSDFEKETPTGMTVIMYPNNGKGEAITQHTNIIEYALFSLPVDTYHSIAYNQSPSEYGSLSFRGMERYETAEVYANPTTSRWYVTREESGRAVTDPEWVGVDQVEGAVVTQDMVNRTSEITLSQMNASQTRVDNSFLIGEHKPLNIIYTITVKVHIEGIYNLRSARASLGGLAEGYFLGQNRASSSRVTHLLEEWSLDINPDDPTKGTITAQITSFGLPYGHQGMAKENEFILSVLLVDNKTILDFPFDVGDKFKMNVEEDVKLSLELSLELTLDESLPDVQPEGGSDGGFNATVDDWGEEEDVDVSM